MPLSLLSVRCYTSTLPQRSWFLKSDAITQNSGHKSPFAGTSGHFPCALITAGSRRFLPEKHFDLCWGLEATGFAMANGSCRLDRYCSRSDHRSPLSAYTYLLMLMYWTRFMEAEVIQHMLPAVRQGCSSADGSHSPYAHHSWISDCHLQLSRWQWHSHQYENHNNITASIKEIIRSTQLLLGNALGLSANAGNGKLYVRTKIKTLISTRLQMSPSRTLQQTNTHPAVKPKGMQIWCAHLWLVLFPGRLDKAKLISVIITLSAIYIGQSFAFSSGHTKRWKLHQRMTPWLFCKQNTGN